MRINGFEQIKSFYSWVFNNPDRVRPTHISLYLFLWNQGNRANWVEWFKCPYDLAMQGACIGNKGTYYRCLDDLQKFKLIKYKKGLNNYKAPQIHLIQLYINEQLTEQVSVPLSEPLSEPQTVPLSGNIYKLLTNITINKIEANASLVNDNISKWIKSEPSAGEEGKESSAKESFDWINLLAFINKETGRIENKHKFTVINKTVKSNYLARLREGYTKDQITLTVKNAVKDRFHLEENLRHLTPDYFSRAKVIDRFSAVKDDSGKIVAPAMNK